MTRNSTGIPTALTIAGSDSGGGAGIQADLKTFAAFGVYGTSAITALTAQNTLGVTGVHGVPDDFVTAQIEAVIADLGCDAVKTGMLANAAIVEAVAAAVSRSSSANLVVDPVMVAKSGDRLLDDEAVHALRGTLLRLARVVTPNIPEAEVLAKMTIATRDDMREAARRIATFKPAAVVMKGGHLAGPEVYDLLLEDGVYTEFWARAWRGAIRTARAARSRPRSRRASRRANRSRTRCAAKAYVAGAMSPGVPLGRGHRPLDHSGSSRERRAGPSGLAEAGQTPWSA